MGAIAVFTYVAAAWITLGVLTIGLLNLAKWSVREATRTAVPIIRPAPAPVTAPTARPAPAPTVGAR